MCNEPLTNWLEYAWRILGTIGCFGYTILSLYWTGSRFQGRYDCRAPAPPDLEALKAGTAAAPAAPDGEVSTNNIEQVIATSFISDIKIIFTYFQPTRRK